MPRPAFRTVVEGPGGSPGVRASGYPPRRGLTADTAVRRSCSADRRAPASAGGHHVITLRAMRSPARLAVPPLFGAVLAVALAAAPASAAPTGTPVTGAVLTGTVHARLTGT